MGHPVDLFIDEQINQEFLCAICHDVLKDVTMIDECEHVFCRECINQWYPNKTTCPVDRETIRGFKAVQRVFVNVLNGLRMRCPFYAEGCDVVFPLGELEHHDAECDYNPENHKDCVGGCGAVVKKCDVKYHKCIDYLLNKLQDVSEELERYKAEYGELPERAEQDSPTSPSPPPTPDQADDQDEQAQGPSSGAAGSGSSEQSNRQALKRALPVPPGNSDEVDTETEDTEDDQDDHEIVEGVPERLQNGLPPSPVRRGRGRGSTQRRPAGATNSSYGHRPGTPPEVIRGLLIHRDSSSPASPPPRARRMREESPPSMDDDDEDIFDMHRHRSFPIGRGPPMFWSAQRWLPGSRPPSFFIDNTEWTRRMRPIRVSPERVAAPRQVPALETTPTANRSIRPVPVPVPAQVPAPVPPPAAAALAPPPPPTMLSVSGANRRNMSQEACEQIIKYVTDEVRVRYPHCPREKEELRRKILAKMQQEFQPGPRPQGRQGGSEAQLYWNVQVHDIYELVHDIPPLHYSRLDISLNELRVVIWC